MVEIIISRKIVQKVNPHNLAARVTSRGSLLLDHQNGDMIYDTSEANKDHWNSLNESSQESLFRRYFQEHIDLEELIEEDKRKKEI
jgi:hypothetical protein